MRKIDADEKAPNGATDMSLSKVIHDRIGLTNSKYFGHVQVIEDHREDLGRNASQVADAGFSCKSVECN